MSSAARPAAPGVLSDDQKVLIERHLGMVGAAVRNVAPLCRRLLSERELESLGRDGLINAARRYEVSLDVPFEIYARFRIEGAMMDGLRREARHARLAWAARAAARKALAMQGDPSAVMKEGIDEAARHLTKMADNLLSTMIATVVAEVSRSSGEEGMILREAHADAIDALAEARKTLPERDQNLIDLHYGDDKDLRDVATALGVSYATARRYHEGVKGRLARRLRAQGVRRSPAK